MTQRRRKPRALRTWILVADSTTARLYLAGGQPDDVTLLREWAHPQSRMQAGELVTGEPGRLAQGGGGHTGTRQPTAAKDLESARFANQVSKDLERELDAFDRLVLVAPPGFLELLRENLSETVARKVSDSIAKDYTHVRADELSERLWI